jgi:hypothetical protein
MTRPVLPGGRRTACQTDTSVIAMDDELEILWDALLSRQAETVRQAFSSLSEGERLAVLVHLRRMANEPGWHPEQRASAQEALKALANR